MNNVTKTIEVLNTLIEINNDRIEGYETASKETKDSDLLNLFAKFIQTSQQCKQELVTEVLSLDGEVLEGTRTTGKFFRVWMDVKAALTGMESKEILSSCEFGEDKAQETYNSALTNDLEYISPEQQSLLNAQRALLKAQHDIVKELRDKLINQK